MPMTTLEVLKSARKKITPESAWTQGAFGRDSAGFSLGVNGAINANACSWCLVGSLESVVGNWRKAFKARDVMKTCVEEGRLTHFNDTHTHAEVLALFDRAIAKLEATHG